MGERNAFKFRQAVVPLSGRPPQAQTRAHPATIQDHIEARHRDIQTLLVDNQRLAATHVALKQELAAAQQELRHLSGTAATVRTESEAQVREFHERSLKIEAEASEVEWLNDELARVRDDVMELIAERKELSVKLQGMDEELVRSRSELRGLEEIKEEFEALQREIQRGRAAVEYEKKMRANNLEQSHAMEKSMGYMAREIEKLQSELANAEKRARAAAAAAAAETPSPGYTASYGNSEIGYGGSSYPNAYPMHQVPGVVDSGPQNGPGTVPQRPHDNQQAPLHR